MYEMSQRTYRVSEKHFRTNRVPDFSKYDTNKVPKCTLAERHKNTIKSRQTDIIFILVLAPKCNGLKHFPVLKLPPDYVLVDSYIFVGNLHH